MTPEKMTEVGRPSKFHGPTSTSTSIIELVSRTGEIGSCHGRKLITFLLSLVSQSLLPAIIMMQKIVKENLTDKRFVVLNHT